MRELGDELLVTIGAARHRRDARILEAVAAENRENRIGRITRGARRNRMRRQVFTLRRPELDPETLAQPLGVARVIRVVMSEDDALDRREASQELLPQLARLCVAYTGIDDRPSAFVLHDPEVDMVERERQRH